MPDIKGKYIIYTADDEMPNCIRCDNCGGGFKCDKSCGPKHGWYGYVRSERMTDDDYG